MSGTSGIGGAGGIDRVMALRAQILERNAALQRASATTNVNNAASVLSAPPSSASAAQPNSFAASMEQALNSVNATQNSASQISESYERGDTVDIAKVMLARQQASVSFEATLQVRNKLLSAYKDIMSMPV
jgi:flagellar hook-basal body complex protein FliE